MADDFASDPRVALERILKCLRLADSENDVEALHAYRTARRLMAAAFLDWADVLAVRGRQAAPVMPRPEETAAPQASPTSRASARRGVEADDDGDSDDRFENESDLDDVGARVPVLDVNWGAIVLRHPVAARITDESWVESHLFEAGPNAGGDGPRLWQGLKDLLDTLYHQSSGPKPVRQRLRKLLKSAKRDGFLTENQLRGLCRLCQEASGSVA